MPSPQTKLVFGPHVSPYPSVLARLLGSHQWAVEDAIDACHDPQQQPEKEGEIGVDERGLDLDEHLQGPLRPAKDAWKEARSLI